MKNLGFAMLICCVLTLDLLGSGPKRADGLAMTASTTMGRVHVELRKAANGPLRVKVEYGNVRGGEYADAISLTLGSTSEEV
jgi:hypothetical protein